MKDTRSLPEVICEILGRKALPPNEVAATLKTLGRMNANVPERQAEAYIKSVLAASTYSDTTKVFCPASYDRRRYRVANRKDRKLEKQRRGLPGYENRRQKRT